MPLTHTRALVAVLVVASTLMNLGCPSPRDRASQTAAVTASHVGHAACVDCHKREYGLWTTSDHARAMAVPNDSTVLGDFNNATFAQHGITS